MTELKSAYEAFFIKHEAGQHFMDSVLEIVASNHTKAEDDPELARDYVQRAKGVKEVIAHINSVMAGGKKIR